MPSKNSLAQVKSTPNPKKQGSFQPVLPVKADGESPDVAEKKISKPSSKPKVQRINKGFQVEKGRAAKWDLLVAQMKSAADKKNGPELIDEALDYLFEKYLKN